MAVLVSEREVAEICRESLRITAEDLRLTPLRDDEAALLRCTGGVHWQQVLQPLEPLGGLTSKSEQCREERQTTTQTQ